MDIGLHPGVRPQEILAAKCRQNRSLGQNSERRPGDGLGPGLLNDQPGHSTWEDSAGRGGKAL